MKVRIENVRGERDEEQRGFAKVFKTPNKITYYQVSLYLDLSEEERAIITQYQLWDVPIFAGTLHIGDDQLIAHPELSAAPTSLSFSIQDLASEDGFHQLFDTPLEATNLVVRLKQDVLPRLKEYIAQSQEFGPDSNVAFEL
jgi:hypothetical protein